MMWSEKHRPKIVQEMIGNEEGRITSLRWLGGWVSGSKPLLLIGPPGTGKTTLVHALARQFEYDLVEMNASDTRSRDSLRERITPILHNTTNLLGQKIMLFLDEVDGISELAEKCEELAQKIEAEKGSAGRASAIVDLDTRD